MTTHFVEGYFPIHHTSPLSYECSKDMSWMVINLWRRCIWGRDEGGGSFRLDTKSFICSLARVVLWMTS